MDITKETRSESYITRPVTRTADILEFMGDREYTARQIAYGLGFTDLNAVKARLTELKAAGKNAPGTTQVPTSVQYSAYSTRYQT